MVEASEFVLEWMRRERSQEIGRLCEELELVSRFSDQLERRKATVWRAAVGDLVASGRLRLDAGVVHFVGVAEASGEELGPVQGSLF